MSAHNRSASDWFWTASSYAVILFLVGIILIPYFIVVFSSFKSPEAIFSSYNLIPVNPTLTAWENAFADLGGPLITSFIVGLGTAVLSLLISIPGAYAFGRKDFPGKELGFYLIIGSLLFPYIILVIPYTDWWIQYGLYNTIPGLWVAYQAFVTPFALWVLRDFFEGLPDNLEEAAQMYGLTQFQAFIRVILPLAGPAIIAVGFLSFLSGWNDFLFSNVLTNNLGPKTAPVALYKTVHSGEQILWSRMMAATIIMGTPPLVLYLIARRYIGNAFAMS
ncbi:trehalose/maltose transport system permease protein [Halogeometricum rufum]|uniref:Trehalose/maltose transport system permease protein n=1 Tax=Halogeometricum rufum TaxID=553469 RepID=A0A1I6IFL3_9EURY|nr:carbohydrate ABC transporter permease [Halogeometricum rufum]SFR65486.1 trehalose/maltose transport system permease protein [Halogeometricum rufum]